MAHETMPSATKLEKPGPGHPCKKMRLGGRQNWMPEEFCLASTCVARATTRARVLIGPSNGTLRLDV